MNLKEQRQVIECGAFCTRGWKEGRRREEGGAKRGQRTRGGQASLFHFASPSSLPSHHPSRPARPPPPALDRYRVDCCLTPPRDPHTSHRSAPRVRPFSSPLPLFFISSHLIAMRSLVVAAVLAGAASLASAASTSVMLYRHANIDKVTSRAARNVAVSLMGGSDTHKKGKRGESGPRMPSRARRRAGVHTGGRAQGASTPHPPAVHPALGLGQACYFHRRRALGRAGPGRPSAGGGHLSPMGRSKGESERGKRERIGPTRRRPRARERAPLAPCPHRPGLPRPAAFVAARRTFVSPANVTEAGARWVARSRKKRASSRKPAPSHDAPQARGRGRALAPPRPDPPPPPASHTFSPPPSSFLLLSSISSPSTTAPLSWAPRPSSTPAASTPAPPTPGCPRARVPTRRA